jgi:alpha-L-rhamnosidase
MCLAAALVSSPRPLPAADPARVSVVGLTVDAMEEPLGIDDAHPRLAWRLESAQRGVMQTAYRVLVASRPDRLGEAAADIWDSKDVAASDPFAIYAGPPLQPRTRYYWSVRVATTGAGASVWSSPGWFETALLSAADWKGAWIAGPERSLAERTPEEGLANDARLREEAESVRFQRMEDGRAVFSVGSGEYHFLSGKEAQP